MCIALRFLTDRLFPDGIGTRSILTFILVGLVAFITAKVLSTPVLAEAYGETVIGAVIALTSALVGFWTRDRQTTNGGGA